MTMATGKSVERNKQQIDYCNPNSDFGFQTLLIKENRDKGM